MANEGSTQPTYSELEAENLRVRGLLQRMVELLDECEDSESWRIKVGQWRASLSAPDANCYTLPNGDCIGGPCMHDAESADIGKLDTADKTCTHRRTTFIIDQSGTDPIVESLMCNDCLKRFEEAGSAETGGEKAAPQMCVYRNDKLGIECDLPIGHSSDHHIKGTGWSREPEKLYRCPTGAASPELLPTQLPKGEKINE